MQNLSLLISQSNPAQTVPSAVSNPDKSSANASANEGASFKELLSTQVRNKQAQTDQTRAAQARIDEKSRLAEQQVAKKIVNAGDTNVKTTTASAPSAEPVSEKAKEIVDSNIKDQALSLTQDKADVDTKKTAIVTDAKDVPVEDVPALTADAATATAIAAPIVPITPQVESTSVSEIKTGNAAADITAQKRSALDADLRAELAQHKKAGDAKDVAVSGKSSEHAADLSEWVDSILPNAAKVADATDAQANKLMAGAKESVAKDAALTSAIQAPVPQATQQTSQLQVAQAASSNVISTPPGKTGWDQAIGQKVVWMVGAAEQSATLTLNPPDLGPLQVVIHVHNDQADATFISDNSEVRKALEDGLSNLRDMMNQSGINLGQTNIGSGSQQKEFEQMAKARSERLAGDSGVQESAVAHVPTASRVSNGLVDTFA
ncbi:MAG: flagellar hook-length control protein FliK [Methylophilaceae bacterium]